MALSVTINARGHLGPLKAVLATATFDTTYPAGGESLVAADLGLTQIVAVFESAATEDSGAVANVAKWDDTDKKLQLFETGAAVSTDLDEQNTADQSAKKVRLLVLGH